MKQEKAPKIIKQYARERAIKEALYHLHPGEFDRSRLVEGLEKNKLFVADIATRARQLIQEASKAKTIN